MCSHANTPNNPKINNMERRHFFRKTGMAAFSIGTLGNISWDGKQYVGDSPTTTDILGPYYRPGSPMRADIIPKGSTGKVMNLSGTVYGADGKTPLKDVLIEAWQCDEHMTYDNTSDDYAFRGAVKSDAKGRYKFRTIIPVPYKDGGDWRPAHIHMRVSSPHHQDLITQVYFKGDPHIAGDFAANTNSSASRILEIKSLASGEHDVHFDITLGTTLQLDDAGYRKVTGLYQLKQGMAEFYREDDLLIMKLNGQIMEGMTYRGNNTFEGGQSFVRARFTMVTGGEPRVQIDLWDVPGQPQFKSSFEGVRSLRYG